MASSTGIPAQLRNILQRLRCQDLDWKDRKAEADQLLELSTNQWRAIGVLVEAIIDPDRYVRTVAILALGRVGPKAGKRSDLIAAVMVNDSDMIVRDQACRVLRDLGPDASRAIPTICRQLNNPQPDLRIAAALMLGRMGKPALSAVNDLVTAYRNEKEPEVREACVRALGLIPAKSRDGVQAVKLAFSDNSELVRESAQIASERIGRAFGRILKESGAHLRS